MRGRPRKTEEATLATPITAPAVVQPNSQRGGESVHAVDRALDILEALAQYGQPVSITVLSASVKLHVSTVHRLLATLMRRGYVAQESANGRYKLGGRFERLLTGSTEQPDLRLLARPLLEKLSGLLGETANLAVRSGDNLVYIDQAQSERLVRMFTKVGTIAPLYCTGAGKALLAFAHLSQPEPELARYLSHNKLEPRTSYTITTAEGMRLEIDRIRRVGYSLDQQEMEPGVSCVAAPVYDQTGSVIAALSISGPSSRLSGKQLEAAVAPLLVMAAELSERLGYRAGSSHLSNNGHKS